MKNLPKNITQDQLKQLFEHHGKITKVVLPPAKSGQEKSRIGFVHFAERSSAMKALKNTEKYEIDGDHYLLDSLFLSLKKNKYKLLHMLLLFIPGFQAKFWSVPLRSHRQIRNLLEDLIHKNLVCFQVIHLVLVMVLLEGPMVL